MNTNLQTNAKTDVKSITVSALLTAIAILIPMYMPFKIVLEPVFSATFASHVPGILALFVGPAAVVGTAIGSALGFFAALGNPWVAARAFMHLVFGLVGYMLAKRRYNIFLIIGITALLHAGCEMLVGLTSIPFITAPSSGFVWYILITIGLGTIIHHCIDFAIVLLIYKPLQKAKILPFPLNYKQLRIKEQ